MRKYTLALHKQLPLILFAKQYFHQPKLPNETVKPLGQHSLFLKLLPVFTVLTI